ncbi:hypothetical protein GEU84_005600 [Fertoebacter nigrum]|uniref:Uncharacterized protein n=1 Tax=Fertoeibacter niger TaxID=2656921 RepID=A0A8X8KK34_9RHOB|nr:hypothetical protein [Fertoeibacter niger]NUB43849.1 hypothetical protein [Fertoeibacter niger]
MNTVLAVGSVLYARRMAKNDTERMRRKALVFELERSGVNEEAPEWISYYLIVRNLEPIGAKVLTIAAKPKAGRVLSNLDAYGDHPGYDAATGRNHLKNPLPDLRRTDLNYRVGPSGSSRSASGASPGDTVYIPFMAKNVMKIGDLSFEWEWADGQKR